MIKGLKSGGTEKWSTSDKKANPSETAIPLHRGRALPSHTQAQYRFSLAAILFGLLVFDIACSKGPQTDDQATGIRPKTSIVDAPAAPHSTAHSAPTTPSASASHTSVPCSLPAPALPVFARDSQVFTSVLKTKRRMHVLGVEGRLLFAATSRAVTTYGPANAYYNQIHELEGNIIRPVPKLQRGFWPDLAIWAAWGHWPDNVRLVGANFGNTAWEYAGFQWDPSKNEWLTWEFSYPRITWGSGSPWEWAETANGAKDGVVARSPEGIPKDLCSGVKSCAWSLEVVAPRDIYATTAGCERGWDHPCVINSILHWCAPRTGFEESSAPQPIPSGNLIAVPGLALLYSGKRGRSATFDGGWTFRDGVWTPINPPEQTFNMDWLVANGNSIWYLGAQGLYHLNERGFERVSVWQREIDNGPIETGMGTIMGRSKVILPGSDGPASLTGFSARTPEELLVTTWNGKESQIW